MSNCPDCGQPLPETPSSAGRRLPGTAKPPTVAPNTPETALPATSLRDSPHWMTCKSAAGMQRRIRSGLEPGYIPITFGRIKRWEECAFGEQQENRIEDRIRTHSDKADVGTAIHRIMEARVNGELLGDDELAKLVPLDKAEDYAYLLRSAESLAITDKREHMLFQEDDARRRWEFPVTLADGSQVIAQVEVKMDLLKIFTTEPLAEVVDYKTGRVVDTNIEDDDQGQLYCAVLTEDPLGMHIEYFDFVQPQLLFWRSPSVRWSRNHIEAFKVRFRAKVEAYAREQDFDTRAGNWCHWCSVAWRCPQGRKVMAMATQSIQIIKAPSVVLDDDNARDMAQTVIQMDAALKQINGWLREYVKLTGKNIDMGDGTNYGQQIKASLKLPPDAYEAAREILANHGFNFDDYVRWDMQDGDGWKFIRGRRGPEAGLLKDLARPETYARWELSKKEE